MGIGKNIRLLLKRSVLVKRKKMGNGRQEERGKEAPHKTTQYRVYGLYKTYIFLRNVDCAVLFCTKTAHFLSSGKSKNSSFSRN